MPYKYSIRALRALEGTWAVLQCATSGASDDGYNTYGTITVVA